MIDGAFSPHFNAGPEFALALAWSLAAITAFTFVLRRIVGGAALSRGA